MSDGIKKEIGKQYFRYFRIWFIIIGILLAVTAVLGVGRMKEGNIRRTNQEAPSERVYDYADVLTDAEEENLRKRIAEAEGLLHIDIVLVTLNQPMEGEEAMQQYGFRSVEWEQNMMDYSDDFWEEKRYGYNSSIEGDGCLLLHNWYEGQSGGNLSTSGRVEAWFSNEDIGDVMDAVAKYGKTDPYKAYLAYVEEVCFLMSPEDGSGSRNAAFPLAVVIILPLVAALGFAVVNLRQKKAADTTTASTYVEGGKPVMRARSDDFIRKSVVTRKIETNSGSSSGRSSGGSSSHRGGGGHHTSRSGASHGGGSRRF